MKKGYLLAALVVITILSWWFYQSSKTQADYFGLPTVSCIDPTQAIKEEFTFNLKITINGEDFPLSPTIGHDPAECLREIYTNDSSGVVYVASNDQEKFTLGDFFNVWRESFNKDQLFGNQAVNGHTIEVLVNGQKVNTFDDTELTPNYQIEIIYR